VKITQERLKELLEYSPETGEFFWKVNHSRKARAGRRAGTNNRNIYIHIVLDGHNYLAHRLAWFYVHGEWPHLIDHINEIKSDNRLCNLREVPKAVNQYNMAKSRGYYRLPTGRWAAYIHKDQKKHHIGVFDTEEEAHNAYLRAKAATTKDVLSRWRLDGV
jgi:hypothetical protein